MLAFDHRADTALHFFNEPFTALKVYLFKFLSQFQGKVLQEQM
jgi:hypothetical protein